MDKILNALKCVNCNEILSSPVIFPCYHSICKHHVTRKSGDDESTIRCGKCGQDHRIPENGANFPPNEALAEIIAANVTKLDFGRVHKEAKNSCHNTEELLSEVKCLIKDPFNFIHDCISDLKNTVQLKEEELKLRIDEEVKRLFDELDDYEKQCKSNAYSSRNQDKSNKLDNQIEMSRSELNSGTESLNMMVLDEARWQDIVNESDKKCQEIRYEFEMQKKRLLLLKKHDQMKMIVEHFSNVNIDSILKSNSSIRIEPLTDDLEDEIKSFDSEILDQDLSIKLKALLKSKLSKTKKWSLIYRASRDGYSAKDFHSKCDNKLDTLTVIKSTLGNIFGGYMSQQWNPLSAGWHYNDTKEFLFSLLNKFNKSLIFEHGYFLSPYEIRDNQEFGLKFGTGPDLYISENSNLNTDSFSNLGHTFKHPDFSFGTEKAKTLLAGSYYFKVDEIEVFQIE